MVERPLPVLVCFELCRAVIQQERDKFLGLNGLMVISDIAKNLYRSYSMSQLFSRCTFRSKHTFREFHGPTIDLRAWD